MTTHKRLSPSGAAAWTRCAGKVREEAKYPDTSGPAAVDGTHDHTLVAACIDDNLSSPILRVGETMTDHEGSFVVDIARAERAKVCIEYVRERVQFHSGLCEVLSERRVDPALYVGRDDMSGTADVQIISADMVEIIDYKGGMGQVDAKDNEQLELYALGALAGLVNTPPKVRMTIVQPKLALKGLPVITSHEMATADLLARVPFYKERAAATDDPNAPLTPGDVQCKFCRAKGNCAALTTHSLEKAGVTFQNLEIAEQTAKKDPAEMSDQQIREVMEAAPLLRQMLESVEAEAERRLKSGHSVPGLKLVNGKGSRKWNLDDEVIAEKLRKMGVPKDTVYKTTVVSPAQVEKLTWEKRDGTKVQLTERQLKTIGREYVAHMGGKLTVALEADSRPAVTIDASRLFKPIDIQSNVWDKVVFETSESVCNDAPTPAESLPAWLS